MSNSIKHKNKRKILRKDYEKKKRIAKQQYREIISGSRTKFTVIFPKSRKWTKPKIA